ncbi:MAG: Flp pilus assembly complex ATPase component TadA [Candidatus Omnitrophica bacterium]|nr:Flp pilus assembly complex ATPase component TadA [Candidatus Omnitrophota bacterium]
MSSMQTRLVDVLIAKGLASREQLVALQTEARSGKRFGQLLIQQGILTAETLVGLLSQELGVPSLSLSKYRLDPKVAGLIPERVARQYTMIPISQFGQRLVVAMADPVDLFALEDVKALTHYAVDPVLAKASEIEQAIEQSYGGMRASFPSTPPAADAGGGEDKDGGALQSGELESAVQLLLAEDASDAPAVKVINLMLLEALRQRASDIHLEPASDAVRVRYRVDGRLAEAHRLPKRAQSTVLTRLKIMAGLDITESRLPQDGRFKVRLDVREVDFRVSVLPVVHGNKIVLRALDKSSLAAGLEQLGFSPRSVAPLKDAVARPHGMILVTGPTGSGKSTTLYSMLQQLNLPTRNIITIEDPVEYQLNGATQVQDNPEIGLTFASGLRSILRQNPDIVMIGEIRDFETADIAMKASLTGHLVLSTLHTNDAPSSVTRLVDMGVEPFLIASSLTVIEAQRLVRKLCAKCRQPIEPPRALLEQLAFSPPPGSAFYRAVGCPSCNGMGYRGRMGLIEVCPVDEGLRERIVSQAHAGELKAYARAHLGMVTLQEDGIAKAAAGLTTLEEILQATSEL